MKRLKKNNKGSFILEALIAVLIFMIGIVGVMQLQLVQMQAVADAQYRTQASYMAENLMSKIILNKNQLASFVSGSNSSYTSWAGDLAVTLPDVASNPPTITTASSPNGGTLVTITINWKAPQSSIVSKYELQSILF